MGRRRDRDVQEPPLRLRRRLPQEVTARTTRLQRRKQDRAAAVDGLAPHLHLGAHRDGLTADDAVTNTARTIHRHVMTVALPITRAVALHVAAAQLRFAILAARTDRGLR